MSSKHIPKRVLLTENEAPKRWYNVAGDMNEPPAPPLSPVTKQPATLEEMLEIFPQPILEQEMSTDKYIDIPEEVQAKYRLFRSTPLVRAYEMERALGTPARIYFKYEGQNPSGSHKLNSAVPQAYYNMISGTKRMVTETGAGQWGTALSMAAKMYGIELVVYMVKVSYIQKPARRAIMNTFGAKVIPSPSDTTEVGRRLLAADPDSHGSLGDAIAECIELVANDPGTRYSLGSVLNHVVLHQTVIGEEALLQFEKIDEYPDVVIGCNGGGSNFSGVSFPFVKYKLRGEKDTRFIAVEAAACPKLTKGVYSYDYSDSVGMAPISMMYTLGHSFRPSGIHAGGLRYHGDSPLLSKLYHDGVIEASAIPQRETFEAAMLFARTEAIVPAPESSHAIAETIRQANICKETGEEKVILFNLSGTGYFDMQAYDDYMAGKLSDDIDAIDAEIARAQAEI
ncbi:MAG: TrpB-like pyridoxal phosphate-dependent enzyme [Oscillospiraceae bacterium]|nr:TrpB-like pyridoxal phosphate-dependent enzyme [Oscillospiraceae bacterium]